MIDKLIAGAAHVFGDNVDTVQIYPGQYLDVTDHAEMAAHCFEGVSGRFADTFKPGDIVIAGANFGCGSSRENAAIALKVRGVSCVVARSFARIFYRNAINLGLPLFICGDARRLAADGEALQIDLARQTAANLDTGAEAAIEPVSEYAMRILDAGGIKPLLRDADAPQET